MTIGQGTNPLSIVEYHLNNFTILVREGSNVWFYPRTPSHGDSGCWSFRQCQAFVPSPGTGLKLDQSLVVYLHKHQATITPAHIVVRKCWVLGFLAGLVCQSLQWELLMSGNLEIFHHKYQVQGRKKNNYLEKDDIKEEAGIVLQTMSSKQGQQPVLKGKKKHKKTLPNSLPIVMKYWEKEVVYFPQSYTFSLLGGDVWWPRLI